MYSIEIKVFIDKKLSIRHFWIRMFDWFAGILGLSAIASLFGLLAIGLGVVLNNIRPADDYDIPHSQDIVYLLIMLTAGAILAATLLFAAHKLESKNAETFKSKSQEKKLNCE